MTITRLHIFFFFIFLHFTSHAPIEINFDTTYDQEQTPSVKEATYLITYESWQKSYLEIKTTPTDKKNPAKFYMSTTENPSGVNFNFLSLENEENLVYVPKELMTNSNSGLIYLLVQCTENCAFRLQLNFFDEIQLTKNKQYTYLANEPYLKTVSRLPRTETSDELNIFAIGASEGDLKMTVEYVEKDKITPVSVNSKAIYNGDIANFNESKYPYTDGAYYRITVEANSNVLVKVGARIMKSITEVRPNDPAIYGFLLQNQDNGKDCFKLLNDDAISNEEISYSINVFTRSRNVKLYFTNDATQTDIPEDDTLIITSQDYFILTEAKREEKQYACIVPSAGSGVTYSFQFTSISFLDSSNAKLEPLLNGFSYSHWLKNGQIQYYRHFKQSDKTIETNFNVRLERGEIEVYVHKCETFPKCEYTKEIIADLKEKEKLLPSRDVNRFYTVEIPRTNETNLLHAQQNLLIVMCNDVNGCKFQVSFFDEDDEMNIKEDFRFGQVMDKGQKDVYSFVITNSKTKKIIVDFNTFSGDSNVEIKKETTSTAQIPIIKTYYAGNKEIYEITKNEEEQYSSLIGTYKITVSSVSANYYSLFYYTITESEETTKKIKLGGGMALLETLKVGETKQYQVDNLYRKEKVPYLTQITLINCKIKATFEGQTLQFNDNYLQHEILATDPKYDQDSYLYTISYDAMYHETPFKDELCTFYISSTPIKKNTELVVNEANPIEFTINNNIPKIYLLFPRPPKTGMVIANFNIESEAPVQATYSIDGETDSTITFTRSRQIIINEDSIFDKCGNEQICPITFELTSFDTAELAKGVHFEFMVKGKGRIPAYLKKNKYTEDIVHSGYTQYFYTDVSPNESGEIILNFNRGSGNMYARLIRKEDVEPDADWNGKVKLPTSKALDLVSSYDQFNKKLIYTNEHTRKCVNGCDLFIAVESNEQYVQFGKEFLNGFNIFIRPTSEKGDFTSMVNVPLGEYVFGSLEQTIENNKYDYYVFDAPFDGEEMIIEFQTEICNLYINTESKGKPSAHSFEYKLLSNGKDSVGKFYKSSITKGAKYIIAIGTKELDSIYTATYNFRVRITRNTSSNLIEITSDQSVLCDIQDDNSYCDFLLHRKDYDDVENLLLYTFSNTVSTLTFYITHVNAVEFDKKTKQEQLDMIPRKEKKNYNDTSENNLNPDFHFYSFLEMDKASYLLISVHSTNKGMITLLTTFRSYIKSVTPNPSTVQLFHITKDNSLTFPMPSNRDYIAHIVSLQGSCEITHDTNLYKIKGSHDSLLLPLSKYKAQSLTFNVNKGNDFIFYFWYSVRPEAENFDEFDYGDSGEIAYLSDFPITFYTKVDPEHDVSVNIQFYELESVQKQSENDFIITGYVTDEDFVLKRKKNRSTQPSTISKVEGLYDFGLEMGIIQFSKSQIEKYQSEKQKYIFIKIEKSSTNKNVYTYVHGEVSVIPPANKNVAVPFNEYQVNHLVKGQNKPNIYKLKKDSLNDIKMRIEFSPNSNLVRYAVIDETPNEANYYTNSSSLTPYYQLADNGKSIIDIEIGTKKEIYLSVFADYDNHTVEFEELSYFTFKYKTSSENFPEYKKTQMDFKTGEIKNAQGTITITVPTIRNKEDNIVEAKYRLRVIDANGVKDNLNLNSIALLRQTIERTYIKQVKDEKTIVFDISDFPVDKAYIVSCIGIINEDNELISYEVIRNPFNIDVEPTSTSSFWNTFLIVVLVILGIAILAGLIFVIIRIKNKKKMADGINPQGVPLV